MSFALSFSALDIGAVGRRLAEVRRSGVLADGADLGRIVGSDEAEDVRDATLRALGWSQVG